MILWSHLIICDLFLHKHLVIKSDHSAQHVVSGSSGDVFPPPCKILRWRSPHLSCKHVFLRAFLKCFFLECFSQMFFFSSFFLKCFLNCQPQMTELPFELQACFPRCPFATIWLTSHWKGKMSGKTRYNWNRIKNVKCVFFLKTF